MRSVRKALGPARLREIPIVSGASGGLEKKLVCALAKFCSRPHGYCESNVAGEVAGSTVCRYRQQARAAVLGATLRGSRPGRGWVGAWGAQTRSRRPVPGSAAGSRLCTPRAHPAPGSRDSTAESRPPRRRSRNDVRRSARHRGVEARPHTPTIGGDDRTRAVSDYRTHPLVFSYDNKGSRTHPAGRRRKLPQVPANPRNRRVEKARSWWESPPIPAQPGSGMTGLSRRRSRVRVPSLP